MSGGEIRVRRARTSDIPHMVELWKEYMEFHRKADTLYTPTKDAPKQWARWAAENIASRESCVLVAETNGNLAGFSLSEIARRPPVMRKQRYGAILDLAVTESFRRQGVATRLFEETKRWFNKHRIDRIELRVLTNNPVGAAFWRRMGFRTYLEVQFVDV